MARLESMLALAAIVALALSVQPSHAQQTDLVNSARQRNVVNVQFFADPNFQQTHTPFAYYDFPPINAGSCSACEDFPVCFQLCLPCLSVLCLQVSGPHMKSPVISRTLPAGCSNPVGLWSHCIFTNWRRGFRGTTPYWEYPLILQSHWSHPCCALPEHDTSISQWS
jgi:hypothetical protein